MLSHFIFETPASQHQEIKYEHYQHTIVNAVKWTPGNHWDLKHSSVTQCYRMER